MENYCFQLFNINLRCIIMHTPVHLRLHQGLFLKTTGLRSSHMSYIIQPTSHFVISGTSHRKCNLRLPTILPWFLPYLPHLQSLQLDVDSNPCSPPGDERLLGRAKKANSSLTDREKKKVFTTCFGTSPLSEIRIYGLFHLQTRSQKNSDILTMILTHSQRFLLPERPVVLF